MIEERGGLAESVELVESTLSSLLRRLKAARFTHGDLHLQNVVYSARKGEPMLIDFDKSNMREFYPLVDASMFLYSLSQYAYRTKQSAAMPAIERAVNRAAQEYLSEPLVADDTSRHLGLQYRYMLSDYSL